jgi:hypothetical protein
MAITVSNMISKVRALGIDAQGSNYYEDVRDFIPAINHSINWLVAVINTVNGESKISEEVFRELSYVDIWQTSLYSRIDLSSANVWTVLAVMPLPKCSPNETINTATDFESLKRTDLKYISSEYYAKRLSIEEWNLNKKNPFEAGNDIISCKDFIEYAYLNPFYYNNSTSGGTPVRRLELEVRPVLSKKLCAIAYAINHPVITTVNDTILFPVQVENMLAEKILYNVVRKEADETSIQKISSQDIAELSLLFVKR